jgi:hypothetical protein
MPVFGSPGGTDANKTRYGERDDIGLSGERQTAAVLDAAFMDSKTWVFHNLRSAQYHGESNLDHVVARQTVAGCALVVVETKTWRPGRFRSRAGTITRDNKPFDFARTAHLPEMAQKLARRVPYPNTTVTPLVAIWPSSPGVVRMGMGPLRVQLPGGVDYAVGLQLLVKLDRMLGRESRPPLDPPSEVIAFLRSLAFEPDLRR